MLTIGTKMYQDTTTKRGYDWNRFLPGAILVVAALATILWNIFLIWAVVRFFSWLMT